MAGLGGLFSPEMMGMGLSLGSDAFQQIGTGVANLGNAYQYSQGFDQLRGLYDRQMGGQNALSGYYSGQYGNMGDEFARQYQPFASGLINDYGTMSQGLQDQYGRNRDQSLANYSNNMNRVNQGYDDRYTRNMQYLEGAGQQERKDINQQFTNAQAKSAADMSERGLGGTTVIPSINAGYARNRADAVGALEERLRQQRLSTDANLSGDALSARERMGTGFANFRYGTGQDQSNFNLGLQGGGIRMRQGLGQYGIENDLSNRYQSLQNRYAMDQAPLNTDYQNTMNMVQHFDRLQFNPPPPLQGAMGAAGALMAPKPQQPETDWYSPLIGGASNVGAGFAGGWGAQAARGATQYVPNMAMGYGFF